VLAVDPDYTWALVGNPNHRSLWILAKTPTLPDATLASIKSQATAAGYDVSKLITIPYEPQVKPPPPIKLRGKGEPPPSNSEKGDSKK
jgi:Lipocalin-like domain